MCEVSVLKEIRVVPILSAAIWRLRANNNSTFSPKRLSATPQTGRFMMLAE